MVKFSGFSDVARWLRRVGVAGACIASMALLPWVAHAQAPLTVLDVPFVPQSEALCGGAAAAMVLRYWGERGVSAESFAQLVDRSAAGIRTSALVDDLRRRGWNVVGAEGTRPLLTRELAQGRPVIALVEDRPGTFHYVVVVAVASTAVLFHDPARAPFRGMPQDEFDRRWSAANRWMAVVLPGAAQADAAPRAGAPPNVTPNAGGSDQACQATVADAARAATAGDVERAERVLTTSAACSASVAFRELAGLRALQRRWAEAGELAASAVGVDPADQAAWRLLATSRFVQSDRPGALAAWNEVDEPKLDTLQIEGLTRTRVPVAARAARMAPGDLVTTGGLTELQRRLDAIPALSAVSVEYVPAPGGLADVRAVATERPRWPTSPAALANIGGGAIFTRTVTVPIGSLSGGGERLDVQWRFWRGRPRLAGDYSAPAPWGGVWSVGGGWEQQPFDAPFLPMSERRSARLSWSDWVSPAWRVGLRGGADGWIRVNAQCSMPNAQRSMPIAQCPMLNAQIATSAGTKGTVGGTLEGASGGERLRGQVMVDGWWGGQPFGLAQGVVRTRSSTRRQGFTLLGQVGAGVAGATTPGDLWFGGDTGAARPVPLRAHRLVVDGEMVTARMGRVILHGSGEGQYWWPTTRARVAAAVFVDVVSLERRPLPGGRRDVDVGAGVRAAVPGAGGTLRVDVAKGLRDGDMRLSFGFEP